MAHFVYIIQSELDGTFYIGESKDPTDRLEKHNRPHKGFTARKQPWKIVYTEEFNSRAEAKKREAFLKKQKSRQFLVDLISKNTNG
ncbi:GIY-YIG nuclease family protein [Lunatimonas salinarum]|uniref:GIY-YIG nuclease family protein n=1 Tax=Lunatimonas salinarum TaxID=1774590 RepID=UPI001AE062A7|nr:GIY-YIG nuclease family protein [Lunatimonas salinarum]